MLHHVQVITPSQLQRNPALEQSILTYGHANFALAILAVVGPTTTTPRATVLSVEQVYLDLLFTHIPSMFILNKSPTTQ